MQRLKYRASGYTSSIGNVSSVERAGSVCNNAVSSIEQATIPVALGTYPAWSGPPVAVIHAVSSIEQAALLVVLGNVFST